MSAIEPETRNDESAQGRELAFGRGKHSSGLRDRSRNLAWQDPLPHQIPKIVHGCAASAFLDGEVAVGGSLDVPVRGSLGEFIQQKIKTKMNPAVYVAVLLIDEGYAPTAR